MKGLILCAGKGLGLRPLTLNRPKPTVMLANEPIICFCIQKLLDVNIRDIGIVIGSNGEDIKAVITAKFPDLHPVYINQHRPTGIAAAVSEAEAFISGEPFLLLLGDNIFAEDLSTLIDRYKPDTDAVIMVTSVDKPEKFGVVVFDGDRVSKVIEKPKKFVSNWAIIGAYIFGPVIFSAIDNIVPSGRGELEITDAIQWLVANGKNVATVKTVKWWLDTGSPENLLKANKYLLETLNQAVKLGKDCTLSNCQLIPPVIIGERCILTDSIVGPYVTLGSDSKLVSVKTNNSLLMDNVVLANIKPVISNSIISSHVNISDLGVSDEINVLLGDFSGVKS